LTEKQIYIILNYLNSTFPSWRDKEKMFKLWAVPRNLLAKAIDLAAELMTNQSQTFSPTRKEKGIVLWKSKGDNPNHNCIIGFISYIGCSSGNGFIAAASCDCDNHRSSFRDIITKYGKALEDRGWLTEEIGF